MPGASESTLSNACNFALDFQEGQGRTPDEFRELVRKYGGTKTNPTTLSFGDGSSAQWDEKERAWNLIES